MLIALLHRQHELHVAPVHCKLCVIGKLVWGKKKLADRRTPKNKFTVKDNLSLKSEMFLRGVPGDSSGISFLMQKLLDPFPPYQLWHFLEEAKPLS